MFDILIVVIEAAVLLEIVIAVVMVSLILFEMLLKIQCMKLY